MSYQSAVNEAAQALVRGEDANWALAELTYENTKAGGGIATQKQWAADVVKASGRRFSQKTASKYADVWQRNIPKGIKPNWTEAMYEAQPRERHDKVAERGAKYTAEKGDAQAAADAVKVALDRPEVADIVIADDDANRNVTHARQRHDDEATAMGELKDPERVDARRHTERADTIYRLVKFRNWAFNAARDAQQWEWTPDQTEEWNDAINGVRGALDSMSVAPDLDQALADLIGDNT